MLANKNDKSIHSIGSLYNADNSICLVVVFQCRSHSFLNIARDEFQQIKSDIDKQLEYVLENYSKLRANR